VGQTLNKSDNVIVIENDLCKYVQSSDLYYRVTVCGQVNRLGAFLTKHPCKLSLPSIWVGKQSTVKVWRVHLGERRVAGNIVIPYGR